MFQNLTGWHFLILLVIILLLFGAPRLPALARSMGQSFRILRGEVKQKDTDGTNADSATGDAPASGTTQSTADASTASGTSTSTAADPSDGERTNRPADPGDQSPRP